jgi:hypothetical protein
MNHIEKKGKTDTLTAFDSDRKIPKVSLPWLDGNDDAASTKFPDYSRRVSPSNVIKVLSFSHAIVYIPS